MLKEYRFSSYVDNSGGIKLAVLKILTALNINTTFPHDQVSSQALGTVLECHFQSKLKRHESYVCFSVIIVS